MQSEKSLNDRDEEVLDRSLRSSNRGTAGLVPRGRQKSPAAERILNAWSDCCLPDSGSTASPSADVERHGDAIAEAATHLALGSGLGCELPPREALLHLQQAKRRFDALGMDEMGSLVRIEAAWRIREAGYPELALRTLESDAIQSREELAHGVRACCLLDLGRLAEAAQVLSAKACPRSSSWPSNTTRFTLYTLLATLQVAAALSLTGQGLECHLSPHALRAAEKRGSTWSPKGATGAGLATLPIDALVAGVPPQDLKLFKPLVALVAACDPSTRAEARTQLMEVARDWATCTDSITAQQWLWAGTAHLLLSNADSATHCLQRAVSQAEWSGMGHVHRMALLDLINVHEQCGEVDKALVAFKRLRGFEAALSNPTVIPEWAAIESRPWEGPSPSDFKNPHLRRALAFLKDANENYSVRTLAEACRVSRRTLENAFKEEMAQSVAQMLQTRRLAIVRWRLISGSDSIKRVALESGYPSASAMCHDFKRAVGSSPGKFRMEFGTRDNSKRTDV